MPTLVELAEGWVRRHLRDGAEVRAHQRDDPEPKPKKGGAKGHRNLNKGDRVKTKRGEFTFTGRRTSWGIVVEDPGGKKAKRIIPFGEIIEAHYDTTPTVDRTGTTDDDDGRRKVHSVDRARTERKDDTAIRKQPKDLPEVPPPGALDIEFEALVRDMDHEELLLLAAEIKEELEDLRAAGEPIPADLLHRQRFVVDKLRAHLLEADIDVEGHWRRINGKLVRVRPHRRDTRFARGGRAGGGGGKKEDLPFPDLPHSAASQALLKSGNLVWWKDAKSGRNFAATLIAFVKPEGLERRAILHFAKSNVFKTVLGKNIRPMPGAKQPGPDARIEKLQKAARAAQLDKQRADHPEAVREHLIRVTQQALSAVEAKLGQHAPSQPELPKSQPTVPESTWEERNKKALHAAYESGKPVADLELSIVQSRSTVARKRMLLEELDRLAGGETQETCDTCGGSGKYYGGGGHFENGKWTGTISKCFRCNGTGKQGAADRLRNSNYDNYIRRIREAGATDREAAFFEAQFKRRRSSNIVQPSDDPAADLEKVRSYIRTTKGGKTQRVKAHTRRGEPRQPEHTPKRIAERAERFDSDPKWRKLRDADPELADDLRAAYDDLDNAKQARMEAMRDQSEAFLNFAVRIPKGKFDNEAEYEAAKGRLTTAPENEEQLAARSAEIASLEGDSKEARKAGQRLYELLAEVTDLYQMEREADERRKELTERAKPLIRGEAAAPAPAEPPKGPSPREERDEAERRFQAGEMKYKPGDRVFTTNYRWGTVVGLSGPGDREKAWDDPWYDVLEDKNAPDDRHGGGRTMLNAERMTRRHPEGKPDPGPPPEPEPEDERGEDGYRPGVWPTWEPGEMAIDTDGDIPVEVLDARPNDEGDAEYLVRDGEGVEYWTPYIREPEEGEIADEDDDEPPAPERLTVSDALDRLYDDDVSKADKKTLLERLTKLPDSALAQLDDDDLADLGEAAEDLKFTGLADRIDKEAERRYPEEDEPEPPKKAAPKAEREKAKKQAEKKRQEVAQAKTAKRAATQEKLPGTPGQRRAFKILRDKFDPNAKVVSTDPWVVEWSLNGEKRRHQFNEEGKAVAKLDVPVDEPEEPDDETWEDAVGEEGLAWDDGPDAPKKTAKLKATKRLRADEASEVGEGVMERVRGKLGPRHILVWASGPKRDVERRGMVVSLGDDFVHVVADDTGRHMRVAPDRIMRSFRPPDAEPEDVYGDLHDAWRDAMEQAMDEKDPVKRQVARELARRAGDIFRSVKEDLEDAIRQEEEEREEERRRVAAALRAKDRDEPFKSRAKADEEEPKRFRSRLKKYREGTIEERTMAVAWDVFEEPFKSERQRRFMHKFLPHIARRWERKYHGRGARRRRDKLVGKGRRRQRLREARLTGKARRALPASAFVFPKERRYPIHDLSHARNALARASGKPEERRVRSAVYRRYPSLKRRS